MYTVNNHFAYVEFSTSAQSQETFSMGPLSNFSVVELHSYLAHISWASLFCNHIPPPNLQSKILSQSSVNFFVTIATLSPFQMSSNPPQPPDHHQIGFIRIKKRPTEEGGRLRNKGKLKPVDE